MIHTEKGDYKVKSCNKCSIEISAARLKAKPNTVLCLTCQSEQESVAVKDAAPTAYFSRPAQAVQWLIQESGQLTTEDEEVEMPEILCYENGEIKRVE